MKNLYIFLLLVSSSLFSQTVTEINKIIGIPDSLNFNREIRIYKGFGITNGTEIFRFYKTNIKEWKAELYKYYHSTKSGEKPRFELKTLNSKSDSDFVWFSALATNVEYLPNAESIQYKLKDKAKVVMENGECVSVQTVTYIMDGTSYDFFVSSNEKQNYVYYANPEGYLKKYPDVDELQYVCELINIVKQEFDIWKE